jgi:chromosome segregation ATPase
MARLTQQHAEDTKKHEELQEKFNSILSDNSRLKEEIETQTSKLEESDSQNASLREQLAQLKNSKAAEGDEMSEEQMQARIKAAQEKTEQMYQSQLKSLQNKMSQFEQSITQKDSELLKQEESML